MSEIDPLRRACTRDTPRYRTGANARLLIRIRRACNDLASQVLRGRNVDLALCEVRYRPPYPCIWSHPIYLYEPRATDSLCQYHTILNPTWLLSTTGRPSRHWSSRSAARSIAETAKMPETRPAGSQGSFANTTLWSDHLASAGPVRYGGHLACHKPCVHMGL